MEQNQVSYNELLRRRNAEQAAEYVSKHHFISKSASHSNMWIFKSKFDDTFFTLSASTEWIQMNYSVLDSGKQVIRRRQRYRVSHT